MFAIWNITTEWMLKVTPQTSVMYKWSEGGIHLFFHASLNLAGDSLHSESWSPRMHRFEFISSSFRYAIQFNFSKI